MNVCKEKCVECDLATELGFCSVTGCIKQNRVSNISIIPTVTVTDIPMVEYVPVVRCRDCKRFAEFTSNGKTMGFGSCNNPQNIMSKCPRTDWFCADGERKEKEDA